MYDKLTENDIKNAGRNRLPQTGCPSKRTRGCKEARAQGDLSENFEYKAAKTGQNRNESRIRYLENDQNRSRCFRYLKGTTKSASTIPSRFYIEEDDETETHKLVTTVRGNSLKGYVSIDSPLGKAISWS